MIDITEDLRLYKELHAWYFSNMMRKLLAIDGSREGEAHPDEEGRTASYFRVSDRLKDVALSRDAVLVTDPTLHQLFNEIRLNAFDENIDDKGSIISDDFFYGLIDKHHPEQIARNLADTKPMVSLTHLVPPAVESLITETREAYSLGLPTACISLCRSTVERVIVDIAIRCGRVEDDDRLGRMGMCDRISLLIDRSVSKGSVLRQQIVAFMEATSNVIHSNVEGDMSLALKLYHDAIYLIQALYGQYKGQFK